jgi:hypothetical protein
MRLRLNPHSPDEALNCTALTSIQIWVSAVYIIGSRAIMTQPTGESESDALRLDFDRRLKLEFHDFNVTSDAGLLPFRELDDALGLTEIAGAAMSDGRRGKNTRHVLSGLLRQSVFGRLAGYDDANDADPLARDPAKSRGRIRRARQAALTEIDSTR